MTARDCKPALLDGVFQNAEGATLHFSGRNLKELRKAFSDTIADYEEWRRERGQEPAKPYSGTLSLRIGSDLHRRVALAAADSGEPVNSSSACSKRSPDRRCGHRQNAAA